MTTTPNLALPQWRKTDRIMMDDFNTAFANIDTHTTPMTVLHDITLEESTSQISFDMMAEEWWKYSVIAFRYTPGTVDATYWNLYAGSKMSDNYHVQICGNTAPTYSSLIEAGISVPVTAFFFPLGIANGAIQGLSFSSGLMYYFNTSSYASLVTLNMVAGSAFLPGAHIRVVGVL